MHRERKINCKFLMMRKGKRNCETNAEKISPNELKCGREQTLNVNFYLTSSVPTKHCKQRAEIDSMHERRITVAINPTNYYEYVI